MAPCTLFVIGPAGSDLLRKGSTSTLTNNGAVLIREGDLDVSLSVQSNGITLAPQADEESITYYYKTTSTDDSAAKPEYHSEEFDSNGWTAYNTATHIPAEGTAEIFVQVVKVCDANLKIYGWGQASAAPVMNPGDGSSTSDSSRDSSTSYTTGVTASGSIYGSIDVFVLTPSATGAANEVVDSTTYNQLRQSVESGYTPIAAFEVQASHSGRLTLSFPVGEQYNGMQFVVKHKTSDGTIETYTGVVENGKVVITVNSLSPFMIAVKGVGKNPNTGR